MEMRKERSQASSSPFASNHYAATLLAKMVRSAQLAVPYYFRHLPRYYRHRRRLGLNSVDLQAFYSPIFEFLPGCGLRDAPLPLSYQAALVALRDAGVRLTIPPPRLEALSRAWQLSKAVEGDFIECGAYEGATSLFVCVLGKFEGVMQRVLVLDTFRGSPEATTYDGTRSLGEFLTPEDQVTRILLAAERLGVTDRLEIWPGLFRDTFTQLKERQLSFSSAHIDANLFSSTLDACEFVIPRVARGGIVVFDDYNGVCDLGARLAIDVALKAHGLTPQPLAKTSAYLRFDSPANAADL
jgi:hypothetical protein